MNKKTLFNAAAVLMLLAPTLTGCDGIKELFKKDLHITNETQYNEPFVAYKDIYLDNDITINAFQGKFESGFNMMVEKQTFDGQGHTITIKGEDGKGLTPLDCNSLFTSIRNSTVKNLNVIYDFAYTQGSSEDVGGLSRFISDSTIENVTVKYNKPIDLDGRLAYDSHDWGTTTGTTYGGLAARVKDSEISHCKVIGDMKFFTWTGAGLVGHLYGNSSIHHSSFEGGLDIDSYPRRERKPNQNETHPTSYMGGIVGKVFGDAKVYACEASFDKFEIESQTSKGFGGFIAGLSYGPISDCRVVAKPGLHEHINVNMPAPKTGVVHTGVATGYTTSTVNRVIFDTSKDPEINKLHLGRMTGSVGRYEGNISPASQTYLILDTQKDSMVLPAPDKNRFTGDGIERISFQFSEISNMIDNAGRLVIALTYSKSTDTLYIVDAQIKRADDEHIILENFYERDATKGREPSINNRSWMSSENRTTLINIKFTRMDDSKTFNDGFNIHFDLENVLLYKDAVTKTVKGYNDINFTFESGEENPWVKKNNELVINL